MDRRMFVRGAVLGLAVSLSPTRVARSLAKGQVESLQGFDLDVAADAVEFGDWPMQAVWDSPQDPTLLWYRLRRMEMLSQFARVASWNLLPIRSACRAAYENAAATFAGSEEFGEIMVSEYFEIADHIRAMLARMGLEAYGFVGSDPFFLQHVAVTCVEIDAYLKDREGVTSFWRPTKRWHRSDGARFYVLADTDRQDVLVFALEFLQAALGKIPAQYRSQVQELYDRVVVELTRTLTDRNGRKSVGYRVGDGQEDPELTCIAARHGVPVSPEVVRSGEMSNGYGHPNIGPNVAASYHAHAYGGYGPLKFQAFVRDAYDPGTHRIQTLIDNTLCSTAQGAPMV